MEKVIIAVSLMILLVGVLGCGPSQSTDRPAGSQDQGADPGGDAAQPQDDSDDIGQSVDQVNVEEQTNFSDMDQIEEDLNDFEW